MNSGSPTLIWAPTLVIISTFPYDYRIFFLTSVFLSSSETMLQNNSVTEFILLGWTEDPETENGVCNLPHFLFRNRGGEFAYYRDHQV